MVQSKKPKHTDSQAGLEVGFSKSRSNHTQIKSTYKNVRENTKSSYAIFSSVWPNLWGIFSFEPWKHRCQLPSFPNCYEFALCQCWLGDESPSSPASQVCFPSSSLICTILKVIFCLLFPLHFNYVTQADCLSCKVLPKGCTCTNLPFFELFVTWTEEEPGTETAWAAGFYIFI